MIYRPTVEARLEKVQVIANKCRPEIVKVLAFKGQYLYFDKGSRDIIRFYLLFSEGDIKETGSLF